MGVVVEEIELDLGGAGGIILAEDGDDLEPLAAFAQLPVGVLGTVLDIFSGLGGDLGLVGKLVVFEVAE